MLIPSVKKRADHDQKITELLHIAPELWYNVGNRCLWGKGLQMRDGSDHTDDIALHLACRRIVRALVKKYDWALLSEDELVEWVLGSIQSEVAPAEVERLAKHRYTMALYEACRQAEHQDRCERGYHELFRFLFRAAHNRWPELAEDATQRALLLVYEQIDRCRNPGTFLAFALYKLQHAFQQEQRARGKERSLGRMIGQSSIEGDRAALPSRLDQQERCQVLLDAIRRLPKDLAQKAILLKFFGGLGDAEISERLGITAGYVRVLRHRGIARLRKDKRLRGYIKGANSEED
jgi:RNA polymerase sigma factor (sigma-70 family)